MMNKKITIGLLVFLCLNVLLLDYWWWEQRNTNSKSPSAQTEQYPVKSFDQAPTLNDLSKVDLSLIDMKIKTATESLSQKIDVLSKNNQVVTTSPPPTQVTSSSSVKEHYVPLGSGSTNATDWQDLPGVEAYVAPSNYGTITGFYFEAGLRVPSGNGQVFARLKNVTDNITLFESEVSNEGTTGKLTSSAKMPIPQTTKLYRVQLRSSLGADVMLDSARLKIFVL